MINISSIKKKIDRITPRLGGTIDTRTNQFWTNASNCGNPIGPPTPVCSTPTFGLYKTTTTPDSSYCGSVCSLKQTCTYFTEISSCAPGGSYYTTNCA